MDSIAIRFGTDGLIEGAVIRRATGQFSGKLAFIGGVIAHCESIEQAIRRHWNSDLGLRIDLAHAIRIVRPLQARACKQAERKRSA